MVELLPEITGLYFMHVPQKENTFYTYYDPLNFNVSVKARVQAMSSFKKRFSYAELWGFFSPWY
jgi:hypothetical protein